MNLPVSITSIASISPLGASLTTAWESYKHHGHLLNERKFGETGAWVASIPERAKEEIVKIKACDPKYKNLDDTVLYAIYASRNAIRQAGWKSGDNFGINIGSSRGATTLFEKYHREFLHQNNTSTLSSPTTTLGNISSWVAHDLQTKGPEISHSITCSTALHALLNGVAWIGSGMTDKFLVGGSEAPLTAFTLAQMRALKIYAKVAPGRNSEYLDKFGAYTLEGAFQGKQNKGYPCRAMDLEKKQNSMVLGEGASLACLEKGVKENSLAVIIGVGYATEPLEHNISISTDAQCFQRSMKMALGPINPEEVDVIVMHAPGTLKGDMSEVNAIKKVFGNNTPALTTNKWKVGHTFGASGMLSMEMAILMLQHQQFIKVPFIAYDPIPKKIKKILVNAVGFGGNAVSILIKAPIGD